MASTERALVAGPYTVESLKAEMEATRSLLEKRSSERRRLRLLANRQARDRRELLVGKQKAEEGKEASEGSRKSATSAINVTTNSDADNGEGVVDARSTNSDDCSQKTEELGETSKTKDRERKMVETGDHRQEQEEKEEAKEADDAGAEDVDTEVEGEIPPEESSREVEGPFEREPELKSRMADKSSSLKFVTAEEDARMRREELAKAMRARDAGDDRPQSAGAGDGRDEGLSDPAVSPTQGQSLSAASAASTVADDGLLGEGVDGETGPVKEAAGGGLGGDNAEGGREAVESSPKTRIKAFGALLEKTLSQKLVHRAPPPGTSAAFAAAAAAAGGATANGGGGGDGVSKSPLRGRIRLLSPASKNGRGQEKTTTPKGKSPKAKVLSPPCKPKSKFFKSINSNTPGREVGGGAQAAAATDATPVAADRPQSPPMLGLLSQIRARASGTGGSGGGGAAAAVGGVGISGKKPDMGGLLAQIRAKSARNVDDDLVKAEGKDGGGEDEHAMAKLAARDDVGDKGNNGLTLGRAATLASLPPPPPPPPPMLPRSLFSSADRPGTAVGGAGGRGGRGGPPPDFLAEVRAKAAAREALRGAAGGDE